MSIADKLVTIAENEKKVYDKGYADGSASTGGGEDVFADFLNDTATDVVIPDGATKIRLYLFYQTKVKTVTLPEGITEIGNNAFANCQQLTTMNLPDTITTLGNSAFASSYRLAVPKLPKNLVSIGQIAFGSTASTFNRIPASVQTIGASAFMSLTQLTEITFEGKPTSIASNAFNSCTNIKTINVPWAKDDPLSATAPWGATNATVIYNHVAEATVFYLNDGTEWAFEEGMKWGEFIDSAYNIENAFGHSRASIDADGNTVDSVGYLGYEAITDSDGNIVDPLSQIVAGQEYCPA